MRSKFLLSVLVVLASFGISAAQDGKKNSRPIQQDKTVEVKREPDLNETRYFYRFTQPNFTIPKIELEFSSAGMGKITFWKGVSQEPITDPVEVSEKTLTAIDQILNDLDFFKSTADYQYEKDYSHLGNAEIKINTPKAEREIKFNWTEDAKAKELAAIFRRITNQYIWMFDIAISRENQPLQSPKLMESLDSMMKRGEIADPEQMIPFLKKLSDDERIPLMSRNRSLRIIKEIEKRNDKK